MHFMIGLLAVLMPLEEKAHAVPHLKALIGGYKRISRQGHGNPFIDHYTLLKITYLLHTEASLQFHLMKSVLTYRFVDFFCTWHKRLFCISIKSIIFFNQTGNICLRRFFR